MGHLRSGRRHPERNSPLTCGKEEGLGAQAPGPLCLLTSLKEQRQGRGLCLWGTLLVVVSGKGEWPRIQPPPSPPSPILIRAHLHHRSAADAVSCKYNCPEKCIVCVQIIHTHMACGHRCPSTCECSFTALNTTLLTCQNAAYTQLQHRVLAHAHTLTPVGLACPHMHANSANTESAAGCLGGRIPAHLHLKAHSRDWLVPR